MMPYRRTHHSLLLGERKGKNNRGFTLIELLVSLAIIGMITVATRTGKSTYERSIFLTSQAYDMALAIREAQVFATNVRRSTTNTGVGVFEVGYGLEFKSTSPGTNFLMFVDSDSNHTYNTGGTPPDFLVRNYSITNGNYISAICTVQSGSSACNTRTAIAVTFRRPDTEACISTAAVTSRSSLSCIADTGISEARITLKSPRGNVRCVRVYANGQISVVATCS